MQPIDIDEHAEAISAGIRLTSASASVDDASTVERTGGASGLHFAAHVSVGQGGLAVQSETETLTVHT